MTGREMVVALKPLYQVVHALTRLEEIAREATRLEQGFEAVVHETATRRAELADAAARLTQTEATISARQQAAETEHARRCAETDAQLADLAKRVQTIRVQGQNEEAQWARRIAVAKAEHDTLTAQLQNQARVLQEQVTTLRAAAKRIADQAASVG